GHFWVGRGIKALCYVVTACNLLFASTVLSQQDKTTSHIAEVTIEDAVTNNHTAEEMNEVSARRFYGGVERDAIVVIGRDLELKKGDSAEAVVVIGGSIKIHGNVREAVVAIGGD